MSNNPFHDAIQPTPVEAKTYEVKNHPHFFQAQLDQMELKRQARNMTRQDMFNNGLLTVADMDDEELRCGRMRDVNGKIPKVSKTMEMVPRDLYDEMVAEHQRRTQEKFRQQLDTALSTMVDIMTDDTVEPKDRADAAKYLIERTMGKQPERVQVAVSRAPWEDIMLEVGRTTRAEHAARMGVIDAEVVDLPNEHTHTNVGGDVVESQSTQGTPQRPTNATPLQQEPDGVGPNVQQNKPDDLVGVQQGSTSPDDGRGRHHNVQRATGVEWGVGTQHAESTPSWDNPATSNPVQQVHNHQRIRWAQCDATEVALRRKAAQKRIADAKSRRKAARMVGVDAKRNHKLGVDVSGDHMRVTLEPKSGA